MAVLSTHVLDGTNGTHAACVAVSLINLRTQQVVLSALTDEAGRLSETIKHTGLPTDRYELMFKAGEYWARHGYTHAQIINEIVVRLEMPDANARYHFPIIFAPHTYSTWASVAE